MNNKITIIGSGPAGLTCAIYSARAGHYPVVIAGSSPGGQLVNTHFIENFPGFKSVLGPDLMMKVIEQAEHAGAQIIYESASTIRQSNNCFGITLSDGQEILSKTVLIATGASHKHLEIVGENEYTNKGVSWCATCDGPMYRGKNVAVVGGGNTALTEALFLANLTDSIYVIHRRDSFSKADKALQDQVLSNERIKILWNSVITKIDGDGSKLTHIVLNDNRYIEIDGLFVAIGTNPSSDIVKCVVDLDVDGYIITNANTETSMNGVFAAGDVVRGSLKQAVYAAGQGALAATVIDKYLR